MSKLGMLRRFGAMVALMSPLFALLSTQCGNKDRTVAVTAVPKYSSIEVIQTVAAWMTVNNAFDGGGETRKARSGILFQLGEYKDFETQANEGFSLDSIAIGNRSFSTKGDKLWFNVVSRLGTGQGSQDPISLDGALELLPTVKKGKKCYMPGKEECCTRKLHPMLEPQAILTYWPGEHLYVDSPTLEVRNHPYIFTHHFTFTDSVRVDVYKLEKGAAFTRIASFPWGVYGIKVKHKDHDPKPIHHGLGDDPPWP